MSHAELSRHLGLLQGAGLLATADVGEHELLFRHALIQDAAYASLLRQDRRRLHQSVGAVLEQLYADRLHEVAAILGHHFAVAEDHPRAVRFFILAGDAALTRFANQEALASYEGARALLAAAPAALAGQPDHAALMAGLGEVFYRLGRHVNSIDAWEEAARLSRQLGQSDSQARAIARAARVNWEQGQPHVALAGVRAMLAELAAAPPSGGLADLMHEGARTLFFLGQPAEAEPLARQALEMAEATGDVFVQGQALTTLALLPSYPMDAKIHLYERAIALSKTHGISFTAIRAHNNLGETLAYSAGQLRAGLDHLRSAIALAHETGRLGWQGYVTHTAAELALWLGELTEIRPLLRLVPNVAPGPLTPSDIALLLMHAQYVRMCDNDGARAEQLLRELIARLHEQSELQYRVRANLALVELLLDRQAPAEVPALLADAVAIAARGVGWGDGWTHFLAVRHLALTAASPQDLAAAEHQLSQALRAHPPAGPLDSAYAAEAEADLRLAQGDRPAGLAALARAAVAEKAAGRPWHQARLLRRQADLDEPQIAARLRRQAGALTRPFRARQRSGAVS